MAHDCRYSEAIQNVYNNRAANYEDSCHPSFVKTLLGFVQNPPLQPGDLVLDLACGTGLGTFLAAPQVAPSGRVIGVDLSEGMLDVARAKAATLPPEFRKVVTLIRHDIAELDRVNELEGLKGRFDLITCASALVLLLDPKAAIASWAEYLKPGSGRLVLDTTHPYNLRPGSVMETVVTRLGLQMGWNRQWSDSEQSFKDVLTASGMLEVDEIQFVPQVGFGVRYYDSSPEAAAKLFDGFIDTGWYQLVRESTASLEKLKEDFIAEWGRSAGEDGMVEERDGVWLAVARRNRQEPRTAGEGNV